MTPWLDKRGLAAHLSCSVRSVELWVVEGMPHALLFGRPRFQAPEVEAWLERTGRLERRGISVDGGEGAHPQPLDARSAGSKC